MICHRKITTGLAEEEKDESATVNEEELAEMQEAKKAKARVARKLLFALKRKTEDETDSQADNLRRTADQIAGIHLALKDVTFKLDKLSKAVIKQRPAEAKLVI